MAGNEYYETVARIEDGLLKCAKRSFDPASPLFVDGEEIFRHFATRWEKGSKFKLQNRTPIQLERDRILYSQGMRKQTAKYHVFLEGGQKHYDVRYRAHFDGAVVKRLARMGAHCARLDEARLILR